MSSAIIRFEDEPSKLIYWKDHAYPTGLGFKLLDYYSDRTNDLYSDKESFEIVNDVPKDIQYEYVVHHDHSIGCQECWWTDDKSYHGGGFRHGGKYDLDEWKEKVRLQKEYSYRRDEVWEI